MRTSATTWFRTIAMTTWFRTIAMTWFNALLLITVAVVSDPPAIVWYCLTVVALSSIAVEAIRDWLDRARNMG